MLYRPLSQFQFGGRAERGIENMSSSINIGAMGSYYAWKRFADSRGYEWFQAEMEPEWCAWLLQILKQSDDDPRLFPFGKWASLQHLEGKVAAMAAGERRTYEEPHEQ